VPLFGPYSAPISLQSRFIHFPFCPLQKAFVLLSSCLDFIIISVCLCSISTVSSSLSGFSCDHRYRWVSTSSMGYVCTANFRDIRSPDTSVGGTLAFQRCLFYDLPDFDSLSSGNGYRSLWSTRRDNIVTVPGMFFSVFFFRSLFQGGPWDATHNEAIARPFQM
jgi:hypothetical protein